ncbi:hypothetical protein HPHPH6_1028 [Helicobacter pylori Hp H-6]|uniref:Uncharacterized protein n=1 Tax=Helicobacter pylori Hp H-6 TaxID=992061 RepID=J0N6D0_HELPX|nr:hypothetical protein HPHPH6_1028 [Helicobacter pylori Hp H-6]
MIKERVGYTKFKADKTRNGLIESPLAPNYKGKDTNPLNLDNPNPTTKNKQEVTNYPNLPSEYEKNKLKTPLKILTPL